MWERLGKSGSVWGRLGASGSVWARQGVSGPRVSVSMGSKSNNCSIVFPCFLVIGLGRAYQMGHASNTSFGSECNRAALHFHPSALKDF